MTKLNINAYYNNKYQIILDEKIGGEYADIFFKSIFEMLSATIIISEKNSILEFYAHSVKHLTQLDYYQTISLLHSLYKQNSYLENFGLGFYCLGADDIVMIDDSIFICINPVFIKEKDANGDFSFYAPFSRIRSLGFFSPEIRALYTIPATVSHKCFYYSLGALAICSLFGDGKNTDDVSVKLLKPIAQTKLYWTILKLLSIDCERRMLLFI